MSLQTDLFEAGITINVVPMSCHKLIDLVTAIPRSQNAQPKKASTVNFATDVFPMLTTSPPMSQATSTAVMDMYVNVMELAGISHDVKNKLVQAGADGDEVDHVIAFMNEEFVA